MKILALDIGAGTEDILLYDDGKSNIENCIKIVLPCASQVFAAKVREATRLCKDLFIKGDVIGGGAFSSALRNHVEKGLRIVMTENAAYTIRNDLEEARELGIEITQKNQPNNFEGETLSLEEVNLTKLEDFLADFNESLSSVDIVAIAVQDHGVFPKGTSNRKFRIQKMKELLESNPQPESLAFWEDEVPSCFLRMKSAVQSSRKQLPKAKVLVMDTSPAAVFGCLKDPAVAEANPVLTINVGNGHTMAAIIAGGRIVGLMEHHTRHLNAQKFERVVVDFANGKLSDEAVFKDNGHGLFFLEEPTGFSKIEKIIATGPNRDILAKANLHVHFAAPAGDVMMTGPIGLVEATKSKFKLRYG